MNEQDKGRAIERANSYRQMMEAWAWKDFESTLNQIRQEALEQGINLLKMEEIMEKRGIVKAIDSIKSELGYILNGAGR